MTKRAIAIAHEIVEMREDYWLKRCPGTKNLGKSRKIERSKNQKGRLHEMRQANEKED